ncbi:MAG: DUF4479 and tRNA-binding domain-containing protein [Streptococcaceae bacterium]|jgi:tRNA-binding protein|nr:DUF4479 and tRNA-binding domain-containing protein [Streptococcaceae bacterium]
MIFSYNKDHVGDVLMIIVNDDKGQKVIAERKGNIARIAIEETNVVVGWNIFEASTLLPDLKGNGQIELSKEQFQIIADSVKSAGFEDVLIYDDEPKFVIGFVKELSPHPDSDHLNIAQVEIDNGKVLQIVAGAPNIEQGQLVVVAKPGAMMPDGSMIWPGQLRGVESFGMMTSPRELQLPNAPQVRGILVLEKGQAQVGEKFNPKKHWGK